jgi:hypothetical protein
MPMVQSRKCPEVLRKTRKVLNKDINTWSLVDENVSEEFASSNHKVFEHRLFKNVGKYVQNHTASTQKTVDFIVRRVRASSLPLSLLPSPTG